MHERRYYSAGERGLHHVATSFVVLIGVLCGVQNRGFRQVVADGGQVRRRLVVRHPSTSFPPARLPTAFSRAHAMPHTPCEYTPRFWLIDCLTLRLVLWQPNEFTPRLQVPPHLNLLLRGGERLVGVQAHQKVRQLRHLFLGTRGTISHAFLKFDTTLHAPSDVVHFVP